MATVNSQQLFPLGPFKMELVDLSSVNDEDTFVSLLSNPKFAVCIINSDLESAPSNAAVTADSKTVTLNSVTFSSNDVRVLVFGF